MTLSETVLLFFHAMFGAGRVGHVARLLIGRGRGPGAIHIRAGEPLRRVLPPRIIAELGFVHPDDLRVTPFVGGLGAPTELVACFVEIDLHAWFDPKERKWRADSNVEAEARRRLEAFPVAPPILVHEGWSLRAIWPLTTPLAIDIPAGLQRASRIQQALAEHLGGRTDGQRAGALR